MYEVTVETPLSMEDLERKKKFDRLQKLMDRCVSSAYTNYVDSIYRKKEFLELKQAKSMLQQESMRRTDELSRLYLSYPAISCVEAYYEEKELLWESTFYESLTREEKAQWMDFNPLDFDFAKYSAEPTFYNDRLPLFSFLIEAIVLEKCAVYLKKEIDFLIMATPMAPNSIVINEIHTPKANERKEEKKVVGKANIFHSTLTTEQIEILTNCINEARVFTTSITIQNLTNFFNGKLEGVLVSNNNRLLAYLMSQLSARNYITNEWQSVIASQQLVLGKAKEKPLTRTDLSYANDSARPEPKGSEIIDKYIKQLKKG